MAVLRYSVRLELAAAALFGAFAPLAPAAAQTVASGPSASIMWGSSASGAGTAAADSAATHATNGTSAGQVNAARSGLLNGQTISVFSIGVQNILSVNGSNNAISGISQTGSNSGAITTSGHFASGSGTN